MPVTGILIRYYQQMIRKLVALDTEPAAAPERLRAFHLKMECAANLFAHLNRSWRESSGTIAKVCAFYLVNARMSRREKRKFTDFMDNHLHLLCQMATCNDLIGELHGYCRHQESDGGASTPLNDKP